MIPKLLEVLDTATIESPETALQRQVVEMNGQRVYVICYYHNNHSFYLGGSYFMCKHESKKFFTLHTIVADLAKEFTPEQEVEYATFCPRNHQEMVAYLDR